MADTTRDFYLTRNEIIESALRKVGAITPGEIVSAEAVDTAKKALNTIVKEWQSKSVFLWTIQEQDVVIATLTNTTVLDEDVIGLDSVYYNDGDDDIPLRLISWRQFTKLTDKTSVSNTPTLVAMKTDVGVPTIFVYPTLSEEVTLGCLVIKRLKDLDAASDVPDIPSSWIRALIYALAADLSPEYSLDLRERQFLIAEAARLFKEAKTGNVEYQDDQVATSAFPK
jgi:hypothetical protein